MFHQNMERRDGNLDAASSAASDPAEAIARIGHQLAHPLRVRLLSYVAAAGPCPFSELVENVGVSAAQVSNHLGRLRDAGLLATQRHGRQSLYRLPNSHLAEVLANLAAAADVEGVGAGAPQVRGTAHARRCYDHLGGRLGVKVLRALIDRGALTGGSMSHNELEIGPSASTVLPEFGVTDWAALQHGRRRFAYNCPDWTEKAPHLGGALGSAVARRLHERGWTQPQPGSRALVLTKAGRPALIELGIRA
jgi:DNA-binding transcriptional ArsR family regulator